MATRTDPSAPRGFEVRPARPEDVISYLEAWQSVVDERRYVKTEVVSHPRSATEERFREAWTEERVSLVAVSADGVVGFLGAEREHHPVSRHVASLGMGVVRDWRRRGVGSALLAEAIRWARESGVEKVELTVYPDNDAARGLYAKYGFAEEGRSSGHSRKSFGYVDEILMGLWLIRTPEGIGANRAHPWRGVIEEYRDRLPVGPATPVVTLKEGGTPLVRSAGLSDATACEVFLKFEGSNPTASFKDRGMTLAVSKAVEEGARAVVCASTGNTSASAAAYAARAGLTCAVLVPAGKVALGKMAQTLAHGATLLEVEANFDRALEAARALAQSYPATLVNSVNPFRLQGQKTAAFEICDALGRGPDYHLTPVGNAGNITSHWMGYSEYARDGLIAQPPALFGFQAAGAAPIVLGRPVADPSTIATAIRIGNPASWEPAEKAAAESGGEIMAVTDRDILHAYRTVAEEGLFAELGSAASVAGLLALSQAGRLSPGSTVVCVLTGHGLKEPDWAIAAAGRPRTVAADPAAIASALEL